MIKKYLLGIGITLLGLIGFSNAGVTVPVGLVGFHSSVDNNYVNTFLKGGGLLTNYLGQGRPILALRSNVVTWWATNGLPYFYLQPSDNRIGLQQGFPQYIYSCDEITGQVSTMPGNCSIGETIDFSGDLLPVINILKSFFSQVVADDYVYYDYVDNRYVGATRSYVQNFLHICWSSHSIGQSLCFKVGKDTGYGNGGPLINSQNLSGMSFGRVQDSWIGYAPGVKGYGGGGNIDGSSSVGNNVFMTGNLMYNNSCTNGYVVSEVSSWYGGINNVCYAGTYNTGIINDWVAYSEIDTGLSYRDLYKFVSDGSFGYYSSYFDWFTSWANAMKRYKLGQIQFDIFNGQPIALYAYFNRLYDSAGIDGSVSFEVYDVVNFCNLALYSDYSEPYKGNYFSDVCSRFNSSSIVPDVTTGEVGDIDDDEILPPGFDKSPDQNTSSGMIVSVDWSGTLSGNTNQNFDGKNFINDFYQKLQSVFQKPINSATGIIPGYILVFLVAIILFRFIQH